jgi:DNA polymerase elongation subunit (family B)
LKFVFSMFEFEDALEAQCWYIRNGGDFTHSYNQGKYVFTPGGCDTNRVLSIERMGVTDDYVYDVETEDGTFMAGVGCNVVKNTDSIYTKFTLPGQENMSQDEKLKSIYKVSEECSKRISATFKDPIDLEMEDIKYPIALYAKKKYVYRGFTKNRNGEIQDDGIVAKGIQTVRRDNCKYVKTLCNPILDEMMYGRDIVKAKKMAMDSIIALLDRKVDIYNLVITKSLKSKYKTVNVAGRKLPEPAHSQLAKKMKKRDPGTAPKPGSRVPFVFIENLDKSALQCDRVEDPEWALNNPKACKIDMLYYLDKQIISPLETIFQVVIFRPDGTLYPLTASNKISREYKNEIARQMWANVRTAYVNKMKGQLQISDFFKKPKIEELDDADSDDDIMSD